MTIKKILLLLALFFIAFFVIFAALNVHRVSTTKIANIVQPMAAPKILTVSAPEAGRLNNTFLIYDYLDKNKNVEYLFTVLHKTLVKKLVPTTLKGAKRVFLCDVDYVGVNSIRNSKEDILGIEVFTPAYVNEIPYWKLLKTMPEARKTGNILPSYYLTHTGKTYNNVSSWLAIWGGINEKTGKPQNTMEIIDIKNDKLVSKTYFPYQGGTLVEYSKGYCLFGALQTNIDSIKEYFFMDKKIAIVPFDTSCPLVFRYIDKYSENFLVINPEKSKLAIYKNNKGNIELKENVKIPKYLKKYRLVNVLSKYQPSWTIPLVFEDNNGKQIVVGFYCNENFLNGSKSKKLKRFWFTGKKINFKNAVVKNSGHFNYFDLITIDNGEIIKGFFK